MPPSEAIAAIAMRATVALVVALAFSPVIRGVTAELTRSVGAAWPFVMEHCRAQATPGCADAEPGPALRRMLPTR